MHLYCFPLAKWASNDQTILPESERAEERALDEVDSTSVLGLLWRAKEDILCFKVKELDEAKKVTKRAVASEGAKIYDPMGYLSSELEQKCLCKEHGVLDTSRIQRWTMKQQTYRYRSSLIALASIQNPRWLGITAECEVHLHTFCDASNEAYGAACSI